MSEQLDRAQAWALLTEFNHDPFHLHHARTVEGVMRYFAQELGYGDEVDFWGIVGLLHDLDFEQYPDQHCIRSQEIMRERGLDERLIHATASHGYGITVDIVPEHETDAVLGAGQQEVRSFLIEVARLQPAKQRGAAHGALDNAVRDLDIANFPRSKQRAILFVHEIHPSFFFDYEDDPPLLPAGHRTLL